MHFLFVAKHHFPGRDEDHTRLVRHQPVGLLHLNVGHHKHRPERHPSHESTPLRHTAQRRRRHRQSVLIFVILHVFVVVVAVHLLSLCLCRSISISIRSSSTSPRRISSRPSLPSSITSPIKCSKATTSKSSTTWPTLALLSIRSACAS